MSSLKAMTSVSFEVRMTSLLLFGTDVIPSRDDIRKNAFLSVSTIGKTFAASWLLKANNKNNYELQ